MRLEEVVGALGELAVRIAGALVGRAYEAEPALLAQLVGEAIDAVGGSTREVECGCTRMTSLPSPRC